MDKILPGLLTLLAAVNTASSQHHERIVGGQTGNIADYPWQVNLRYNQLPACGGSIISPEWILTAAHCFPSGNVLGEYDVIAGVTNLDPGTDGQVVLIKNVIKYPTYNQDAYTADVALVNLVQPLAIGAGVSPIILPAANVQVPAGLLCSVTGWGNIRHADVLPYPKPLQVGLVAIVSQRTCQCLHNINPTSDSINTIQSDMMCAGSNAGTTDACQGDSGGPLSCSINGQWYQVGIVSWGDECGAQNRPGVYVMVSVYSSWIQSYVSDCNVQDVTINQQPLPDADGGCVAADGSTYPYPNRGAMILVTFISLPLYLLSAYLLTNL